MTFAANFYRALEPKISHPGRAETERAVRFVIGYQPPQRADATVNPVRIGPDEMEYMRANGYSEPLAVLNAVRSFEQTFTTQTFVLALQALPKDVQPHVKEAARANLDGALLDLLGSRLHRNYEGFAPNELFGRLTRRLKPAADNVLAQLRRAPHRPVPAGPRLTSVVTALQS